MNEERIEQLIESYLGDHLSDDEKAELANWLDEAESHRAVFREAVELECALGARFRGRKPVDVDDFLEIEQGRREKSVSFSVGLRNWEHLGIAALFFLCLTLGWLLWSGVERTDNANDFSGIAGSMARLVRVGEDAVFSQDHEMPSEAGRFLGKGWMLLDEGAIEITFHSGATVEVTGPAVFGIDTAMRGFLDFGQVSVHAPEQARDFVVGTTAMEIVDLGTRFNVSVDQDTSDAEVSVTEGLVDLHLGGEGTERRIQPLPAGLLARVDALGDVLSIDGEPLNSKMGVESALVAHWTLDEITANGTLADSSGNERHAMFRGDVEGGSVPGVAGSALDLRGGRYLDISDHIPALTEVSTFTFAAWVRDARDLVFSLSDGSPRNRVQIELQGNRILYGWQQGAQFDAIQGRVSDWKKGRWYHVAVSMSGGVVTIYRDGRALNSRSVGQKISAQTLALIDVDEPTHALVGYLPLNHRHQPQTLGGQIEDVQFYRRALDVQAVQYLYENPGAAWIGAVGSR